MNEEPTKDLATRAFQKRVLDEFAAVRTNLVEIRTDVAELRTQQTAMAKNIAALDLRVTSIEQHVVSLDQRVTSIDHRITTLEEKVDARLKETRPIWETVQSQLQRVVEKFDVVLRDIYDVRIDVQIHGRRIGDLERRAS
jgi:predicted  nucleic acid-binding Zn-ribbon protein